MDREVIYIYISSRADRERSINRPVALETSKLAELEFYDFIGNAYVEISSVTFPRFSFALRLRNRSAWRTTQLSGLFKRGAISLSAKLLAL